jgi:hypothetical protein
MYWLRLCPHSREPSLEALLVRRRLFIVLMTAAHISPNVFSLQVFLTNVQWTFHYSTRQWHTSILYITFIRTFTSSYYTSHSYTLTSSFLLLSMAGWVPLTLCVRYKWFPLNVSWTYCLAAFHSYRILDLYFPWKEQWADSSDPLKVISFVDKYQLTKTFEMRQQSLI